jgi:hypothetical protein
MPTTAEMSRDGESDELAAGGRFGYQDCSLLKKDLLKEDEMIRLSLPKSGRVEETASILARRASHAKESLLQS